jgi:seryl-tRNA synthetase
MKKRIPFTEQDEDNIDSVFHWRRKYNESVDKWVKLDSQILKMMRENELLKAEIKQLKGEV